MRQPPLPLQRRRTNRIAARLDVSLSDEQVARPDTVSAIDPAFPHAALASDHLRRETRGDMTILA